MAGRKVSVALTEAQRAELAEAVRVAGSVRLYRRLKVVQ